MTRARFAIAALAWLCAACGGRQSTGEAPDAGDACTNSCPVVLVSGLNAPVELAVDAFNVYWTSDGTGNHDGTVVDVAIDGGNPVTLASGQFPVGLAVGGANTYWADQGGAVMRVAVDGTGGPTALVPSNAHHGGVAVDATRVYWTDVEESDAGTGAVRAVPIADGGSPTTLASANGPVHLAVDATSVYWESYEGILKVPLVGGTPTTLALPRARPAGTSTGWTAIDRIAVDGVSVYWTSPGDPASSSGDGTVMKVAVGGGTAVTLASGQIYPSGLAVDGLSVYWTTVDGKVMKVPKGGGEPVTLASGQHAPTGIAVDGTSVYWTNAGITMGDGSIMKLTPK